MTLAVYVPSFLVAIGQQALLIMLPLYALELGGGAGLAATFLGLNGIGRMVAALPSGSAISRFGDQRTMLGGLALIVIASLLLVVTNQLWLISILALALGAGVGAWMLARLHYVAEHCPSSHRGRAMTILAGMHRFGALVGPILGGLVAQFFGYDALFLCAAGLGVIGIALVMRFTKKTPPEQLKMDRALGAIVTVVGRHKRIFATAGVSTIAMQFVRAGRQLLLPLWGSHIGLDAAEIGLVFGLSSAIDVCMFYPAGYIMDHWGRKWAMTSSMLLLGITLGMLPASDAFASYLVIALLSGFANGLGTGIIMTLGADLSPLEHRGEFLGVWRLIGDLGSAVGPFLMGGAAKLFALTGALYLNVAIGAVGSLLMIVAVKETLKRPDRSKPTPSQPERSKPEP